MYDIGDTLIVSEDRTILWYETSNQGVQSYETVQEGDILTVVGNVFDQGLGRWHIVVMDDEGKFFYTILDYLRRRSRPLM